MKVKWIDEKWDESLIWCPSQCTRRAEVNGEVYTLYLRWRWDDPWQFRIWKGNEEEYEEPPWSDDLFMLRGLFFRDEELPEAEKAAEGIFLDLVEEGKLEDLFEAKKGDDK